MATHLVWTSAAASDIGRVRSVNEDACLDLPLRGLWAVADGMGGHDAGDVASRMVVDALGALEVPASLGAFVAAVRDALQAVNLRLRDEAASRRVRAIGSTVAACLSSERTCALLWAGDSRAYLYRDARLQQVTRDHTQVEALRAQGYLTAEEARHHPAHHLITRAVGAADRLELDETRVNVRDGDVFLLCSDGLTNEVDDADIAFALMRAATDCSDAAHELIAMALAHGGRDNVSAIVTRASDPDAGDRTLFNPSVQP
jgi:protein phosphatase